MQSYRVALSQHDAQEMKNSKGEFADAVKEFKTGISDAKDAHTLQALEGEWEKFVASPTDANFETLDNAATGVLDDSLHDAGRFTKSAHSNYSSSQRFVWILLALAVAGAAGIGFLLTRTILPRVRAFSGLAGKVAEGDLTQRVETGSRDELGQLGSHLNEMVESLGAMAGRVLEGAEGIASSANEILASVTEQNASANQQSASASGESKITQHLDAEANQQRAGREDKQEVVVVQRYGVRDRQKHRQQDPQQQAARPQAVLDHSGAKHEHQCGGDAECEQ